MAAPTIRGVGTVDANTAAVTPGYPTGTAAGDLALMFIESANTGVAVTATDWNEIVNADLGLSLTTNARLTILYRTVSNPGTDNRTTSDSGNHQLARIIGVEAGTWNTSNPFNVTNNGTSGSTLSIPGADTTVNDCLILAAQAAAAPDADTTTEYSNEVNASLTSLTEQIDNTTAQGNGGGLLVISGVKATAGTVSATTADAVSTTNRAYGFVAIEPPAAGGTTVTPGVIARSFTVPAVTVKGAAVKAVSAIARSFTTPAVTVKGSAKTTPAAIATVVATPAVTVKGSAVVAPAATARSFTIPQVTAGEGATPGSASPAATATTVAIGAVTVKGGAVTTPSAIERTFAVNAVTVKGSAVVTPAAIARSFTIPQVTPLEGATPGSASPAMIARSFTVPATTVKGGAVTTPATVARSFSLDAVTVKGSAVVAPSTIARSFTMPSTVQAGSTVAAPSTIARSFTFGQVTPSGAAVVDLNVIPISAVMPAVTVSTVIPDFWNFNPAGYTLNPAAYAVNPAAYTPVTKDDDPPWD